MHFSVLLFSSLAAIATAIDPVFFISTQVNWCGHGDYSYYAAGNTDHGNLCAYVPTVQRVWACPAPDGICWSEDWRGSTTVKPTPASNETVCSTVSNGITQYWFCVKDYETCSQNDGQVNNCWSTFSSPLNGVDPSVAVSVASNVVAAESATGGASFSSAAATSVVTSTTKGSAATTTAASGSLTSAAPSSSRSSSSSSSLPAGAYAGIGVGCGLAVVAVAAGTFFFCLRRKHSKKGGSDTAELADTQADARLWMGPSRGRTDSTTSPVHSHSPMANGYYKDTASSSVFSPQPHEHFQQPLHPTYQPVEIDSTERQNPVELDAADKAPSSYSQAPSFEKHQPNSW